MGNFLHKDENKDTETIITQYDVTEYIGKDSDEIYNYFFEKYAHKKVYLLENKNNLKYIDKNDTIVIYYNHEDNKVTSVEFYKN